MIFNAILRKIRDRQRPAPAVPSRPTPEPEAPRVVPSAVPVLTQSQWDRSLSPVGKTWLAELPPAVRPTRLAEAFPRIANRLALVWSDAELADKVLGDLLVDKRSGRQGFPVEVSRELLQLHSFLEHRRQRSGTVDAVEPGRAWDRHLQASIDR